MAKRYKCPYCELRDERKKLIAHIDKRHEEMLPEGYDGARTVYDMINHTNGHGTCRICKKDTQWNMSSQRYDVLCGNPKCKEAMREEYKKNMIRVKGTYNILNDPEQQQKMLANRKISGKYRYSDGTVFTYTGSYEKKLLEFEDAVMNIPSKDIMMPGPTIEYMYNGKKHFYIADQLYIPYNLIIEIKDGGDNKNGKETPGMIASREKTIEKEKVITDKGEYNYLRLTNNDFVQLIEIFMELKDHYLTGDDSKIVRVHEAYAKNENDIYYNKDKFDSGEINLCFITGHSGSGKSTMGRDLQSDSIEHYELDDLQCIKDHFTMENLKEYGDLIYSYFSGKGKKFYLTKKEIVDNKIPGSKYEDILYKDFVHYAMNYAKSHKNKKYIIEGVWLLCSGEDGKYWFDPEEFKDYAFYIKGTSMIISKHRAALRDAKIDNDNKIGAAKAYLNNFIRKNWKWYFIDEKRINRFRKYFKELDTVINESTINNKIGYLRSSNNDFDQLIEIFMEPKDNYMSGNDSKVVRIHEGTKSVINPNYKPNGKKDLSSFKKVHITESVINKYKKEYPFLSHVRCKDTKEYTCDGYIWFDDNELVAMVGSCQYRDDKTKWVVSLEIIKKYRGYGLSKQILDYAVKTMNCKYLSVNKNNKVAKKVYDDYGFKVYQEDDTMYYMTIDKINESCINESNKKHLYFYHLVPKDLQLDPGITSLQYQYKTNKELFYKNSYKYRNRIVNKDGWNFYPDKDAEELSFDDIINALNKQRESEFGASFIYLFKFPPYNNLGPQMKKVLSGKDIYRIDLYEIENLILDVDYGYYMSNKSNKKMDEKYYINITPEEYFKDYSENDGKLLFAHMPHIGIRVKGDFIPKKYCKKIKIPNTINDVINESYSLHSNYMTIDKNIKESLYSSSSDSESSIIESKSLEFKELLKTINTPKELSNWMKTNIHYKEYDRLMTANEVFDKKKGSCHDQVNFEVEFFKKFNLKYGKEFIIEYNEGESSGGRTHSFIWFTTKGKYYWFENAWGGEQGIHGPYDSIIDIKKEVKEKMLKNSRFSNVEFSSVKNVKPGMSLGEFVTSCLESTLMESMKNNNKLYFLSTINMNDDRLTPRIPSNYFTKNNYEENKTPRVCFAKTIDGCLMGLSKNLTDKEFYVHVPDPDGYYNVYNPTIKEVPDCKITGEVWIKKPVDLKCIGKIKVLKDTGEAGIPFKYGDKTAELYKWDWKWVDKYDNESINESFIDPKVVEIANYINENFIFNEDYFNVKMEPINNNTYLIAEYIIGKNSLDMKKLSDSFSMLKERCNTDQYGLCMIKDSNNNKYNLYLTDINVFKESISKGPNKCPKCGGKVGVFIEGEPIYKCIKCGKFLGVVPCHLGKKKK